MRHTVRRVCIWARSRNCGCLVTWFCYQLIAKPGKKTAAVSWPDPYFITLVKLADDIARLEIFKCRVHGAGSAEHFVIDDSLCGKSLQWRNHDHDGVSNHQPHDCLLNRLFRRISKKSSKLRVTGPCAGNSPGTGEFPAERASNEKMFPFDDVTMIR